jgi:hypothetical protein
MDKERVSERTRVKQNYNLAILFIFYCNILVQICSEISIFPSNVIIILLATFCVFSFRYYYYYYHY